jgi:hypothetical protein
MVTSNVERFDKKIETWSPAWSRVSIWGETRTGIITYPVGVLDVETKCSSVSITPSPTGAAAIWSSRSPMSLTAVAGISDRGTLSARTWALVMVVPAGIRLLAI